jgi:hypothetical protein
MSPKYMNRNRYFRGTNHATAAYHAINAVKIQTLTSNLAQQHQINFMAPISPKFTSEIYGAGKQAKAMKSIPSVAHKLVQQFCGRVDEVQAMTGLHRRNEFNLRSDTAAQCKSPLAILLWPQSDVSRI